MPLLFPRQACHSGAARFYCYMERCADALALLRCCEHRECPLHMQCIFHVNLWGGPERAAGCVSSKGDHSMLQGVFRGV